MQALDCGSQALVIVSAKKANFPVVYVNTAFETLTGMDAGEIIGGKLSMLVESGRMPVRSEDWLPNGDEPFEQSWRLQAGGAIRLNVRQTPLFERPGKPAFWLLTVLSAADSNATGAEAALRDALQDARRKIKRLERIDSATGVPNEDAFTEIMHRDWAIARREQKRLGVVLFCVDFLDEYRDSLGRHATDSVLRKVAHAINGSLRREGDFGARVGDDRFAVVLGTADETQVRDLAERVAKKVGNLAIPHPKSPVARNITISHGYSSEVPEWTSVCNTLLENAERMLVENRPDPDTAADADARADLKRHSL
ncbi:MAG: diguanylate cyclase domain-containing protein [Gammaproteobacteria bacterium]